MIFERASRKKLRIETQKGYITVEDLWDIPLTNGNRLSLDNIYKGLNKRLKETEEESIIETSTTFDTELKLAFDVVTHIIKYKMEMKLRSEKAVETKRKKERLMNLLAKKQNEEEESLTKEQIEEMLADL